MTYKEAREYLIPVAANCVLPQYAAALEKAMEALEEVERYRATELEPEEIEQTLMNFSGFLCEMTGNRMSKTNYTLEAMVSVANDYAQTICAECPDRKELEELNIDRLRELAQADKEGRVVVLPCNDEAILCRDGVEFKADHWNHHLTAFADDMSARYGKRVVLFSIEEAEAALKGEYHG